MTRKKRYTCKQCGILIGEHNQYLHDGMYDKCFFDVYFPEDTQIYEKDVKKL